MAQPLMGFGELPCRLAEAVGLDPKNLTGFTIEVFPDRVVEVRSNHRATADGVEQAARLFDAAKANGSEPAVAHRPFIPVGRFEDLRIRAAAGSLTNAERLALAVLAGGREGEEAVLPLIDAAQEEWSHGSYRVPVRVVADGKRVRLVITTSERAERYTRPQWERLMKGVQDDLREWFSGRTPVLMLPAGWSAQVYEIDSAHHEFQIDPRVDPRESGHAE